MKTNITFLVSLFLFTGLFKANAQCSPTGTITAAGFANITNIGLINWTNATNAYTSDNMRSSASTVVGALNAVSTNYLTASNFNLFVPGSAFVCGLQVNIEHRSSGLVTGASVRDNIVQLKKGNQLLGVNKASSLDWNGNDEVFNYGGPYDMWGASLTPGDLNSPGFGVAFSATLRGGLTSALLAAEVDAITITIYYTMPLPVEFTRFTADARAAGGIGLSWQTATETNSNYFSVERSSDALNFREVGVIKASGNSQQPLDYRFTDESPLAGQSYYRIRQVDNNGSSIYSEMRSVNYQRPATLASASADKGRLVVKMYSPEDMAVELEVTSITGQRIRRVSTQLQPGTSEIRVDANGIEAGIYFIKARMGSGEYFQKVYLVSE
jgi:hypothetical protein